VGRYTAADLRAQGISEDAISSLKVQPGYRVKLYENDNFQGSSLERTDDQSCLPPEWNDRVSSVIVEPVSPTVTAFKDCDFKGKGVELPEGEYTLADLFKLGVTNDDISSLRVAPGYEVTVYADDNFKGAEATFSSDNSCLGDYNDFVSSLKIRKK
jgi:hypothetical protein